MIPPVTQRPRARLDLLEQFVHFGEESSVELAQRYFAAVDEICALLVRQPMVGVAYDSGVAGLKGMRRFPIRGFDLPRSGGIDVVRVLHGARDIYNLFAEAES